MEPLGLWLIGVGVADLVAAGSGAVESRTRAQIGWSIGLIASVLLAIALSMPIVAACVVALITGSTSAAWLWGRHSKVWSVNRALALVLAFVAAFLLLAALEAAWPSIPGGLVADWLDSLDYLSNRVNTEELVLFSGLLVFLMATANGLVRAVLRIAGTPEKSRDTLRGGRIIGPLERILIFGLAVAGELTAASLVVSAKGLLRFPELSHEKVDIHGVTEYFLVGSLTSWLIALAPIALVGAA